MARLPSDENFVFPFHFPILDHLEIPPIDFGTDNLDLHFESGILLLKQPVNQPAVCSSIRDDPLISSVVFEPGVKLLTVGIVQEPLGHTVDLFHESLGSLFPCKPLMI